MLTFGLLVLGGTVTSRGAALSVPDYPSSYGYNFFLLPVSMWRGGILFEHTHRLLGAAVGLATIVLVIWLWRVEPRRPWLRWLGLGALALVIVQGLMGGLRVTQMSNFLALLHGVTAQLFLCMVVLIAAATGSIWHRLTDPATAKPAPAPSGGGTAVLLAVVFIQSVLGAAVRHGSAGLAIPDFPSSYGGLLPPLAQDEIILAHDEMFEYDEPLAGNYPTPAQVAIHLAHRAWALVVIIVTIAALGRLGRNASSTTILRPCGVLGLLMVVQIALGAAVILSGRHPEAATAHQATGAAVLATTFLILIRVCVLRHASRRPPVHAACPGCS